MRVKRRRIKKLLMNIKEQVEFYFSDANLSRDKFFAEKLGVNGMSNVPLMLLTTFNCLKEIGATPSLICRAVKTSNILQVSKDHLMIGRKYAFTKKAYNMDHSTIYVESLPTETTIQWIKEFCSKLGSISHISLPRFKSGFIKGFAFIEFECLEDAVKACGVLNDPPRNFFPPRKSLKLVSGVRKLKNIVSKDYCKKDQDLQGANKSVTKTNVADHSYFDFENVKYSKDSTDLTTEYVSESPPLFTSNADNSAKRFKRSQQYENFLNGIDILDNVSGANENDIKNCNEKMKCNTITTKQCASGNAKKSQPTGDVVSSSQSFLTEKQMLSCHPVRQSRKRSISESSVSDKTLDHRKRFKFDMLNDPDVVHTEPASLKKSVNATDKIGDCLSATVKDLSKTPVVKNSAISNLSFQNINTLVEHARRAAEREKLKPKAVLLTSSDKHFTDYHLGPSSLHLSKPAVQSEIVDVTMNVTKKRKKRRKHKRKFQSSSGVVKQQPFQITAMMKVDWLECKKYYIRQQRNEMGNLKSILHNSTTTDTVYIKRHTALNQSSADLDIDNKSEDNEAIGERADDKKKHTGNNSEQKHGAPTFIPGVIVHLSSLPDSSNATPALPHITAIKTHFADYGEICYVDVKPGATQGFIRYKNSDSAQHVILDEQKYGVRLLTGSEEESYWDSLLVNRELRRSRERPKIRGRQKLVDRAEHAISQRSKQHIKFNVDFE